MGKEIGHREGILASRLEIPRSLRMHFLKEMGFVCNTEGMVTQRKKMNKTSVSGHLGIETPDRWSWLLSQLYFLPAISVILGKSLHSLSFSVPSSKLGKNNSICLIDCSKVTSNLLCKTHSLKSNVITEVESTKKSKSRTF